MVLDSRLERARRIRRLALLLAVVVMGTAVALRVPQSLSGYGSWGSDDFIQYWSAGRLLWTGANPYDPDAMLKLQRSVGLPYDEPKRTWNPPWSLPLDLLISALPFNSAVLVWLVVQLCLLLMSGVLLWRYFAPGDARYWIGAVLAALFVPALVALRVGQISPWLLAGVAGFLALQDNQRDPVAGVALALVMIKPHFTCLFWMAALWWAWREHRRGVLLGWAAALAGGGLIVTAVAPGIWGQYVAAARMPPLDWASCTLGAWLRYLLGLDYRWLQFLPPALGGIGLLVWLCQRRGPWEWRRLAPPLLLASAMTAAYGWSYDQVVLLPVAVDLISRHRPAGRRRKLAMAAALALIQVVMLVQNQLAMDDFFRVWHSWALAGLYWWGARDRPIEAAGESGHDGARESEEGQLAGDPPH